MSRTWDVEKAVANLEKHKVSFELAERALDDPFAITFPNDFCERNGGRRLDLRVRMGEWCFMSSTHGRKMKGRGASSALGARQALRNNTMKKGNPKPLTKRLQAELDALANMPDTAIDTTDMPPISDWSKGERGALFRPVKRALSVRIDADIIDWFQRQGSGYQTRMNAALREYVERHRKSAL